MIKIKIIKNQEGSTLFFYIYFIHYKLKFSKFRGASWPSSAPHIRSLSTAIMPFWIFLVPLGSPTAILPVLCTGFTVWFTCLFLLMLLWQVHFAMDGQGGWSESRESYIFCHSSPYLQYITLFQSKGETQLDLKRSMEIEPIPDQMDALHISLNLLRNHLI